MKRLLILAMVPLVIGCMMTPAIGGKTNMDIGFEDRLVEGVDPSGAPIGQTITYHMKIKAPAGVDLAQIAEMNQATNADGSSSISVASDSEADTTRQAEMIEQVSQIYSEAFGAAFSKALEAAVPMFSDYMAHETAADQIPEDRPLLDALQDPGVQSLLSQIVALRGSQTPQDRELLARILGLLGSSGGSPQPAP